MAAGVTLLESVATGLLEQGNEVLGGHLVEPSVLAEIARRACAVWEQGKEPVQARAELLALAQASPEEFHQQVEAAVARTAPGQPTSVREAIADYLLHVPSTVRRSLGHLDESYGPTCPPAGAVPPHEALLASLPVARSLFRAGDRPPCLPDWQLVALLGIGGFGEVWKATNPHLPPVALKFCRDGEAVPLLRNETALLARVMREGRHPGIVQLLDTFLGADPPFLKFELVEGGDLVALIRRWYQHKGGPSFEQATHTLLRLAEIMRFAHRLNPPLVHRDLKPANILVQKSRTGEPVFKITDFGIGGLAIRGQRATLASSDAARGAHTPLSASPQQIRGEPADPRDDVHALGVIWYQMLVADLRVAPARNSQWQLDLLTRGISVAAISLLGSCVSPDAADRPADAGLLADRLRDLLPKESPPTQEHSGGAKAVAPSRASRLAVSTLGAPWIPLGENTPSTAICPAEGVLRPSTARSWPGSGHRLLAALMSACLLPVCLLVAYLCSSAAAELAPEPFDQIRVGMSESEVKAILGEPTLSIQVPSRNRKELNWQQAEEVIAVEMQNNRVEEKRRTKHAGRQPMR
jgi:serine/threonine protein kinase